MTKTKDYTLSLFGICFIDYWILFVIYNLFFGIYSGSVVGN